MKLFKKNLPKEVELFVRKVAVHVTFIIIIQHQFRTQSLKSKLLSVNSIWRNNVYFSVIIC